MIDFSKDISDHCNYLISRANELPLVRFEWQPPILLDMSKIENEQAKDMDQFIQTLSLRNNQPAIYYFKMVNCDDTQSIIDKLREFKALKSHACPKIDKRNVQTEYLYCGSVQKNLRGRFLQHLGRGHNQTYSLQLIHWAKDLDLCLEYHYAWVDKQYAHYTELLESALTKHVSPLVGKPA